MSTFWLNTATGRRFDFLNPKAEDIDIVDIAVSLSHQARYAGHTRCHYSVASHSIIIANTLDVLDYAPEVVAWGLLHDAAEAYVTDIPWPLKAAGLVPELSRVEKAIMAAVAERFGLAAEEPAVVKDLDLEILDVEASRLLTRHADWPAGTPRSARRSLRREFESHLESCIDPMRPACAAMKFVRSARHLGLTDGGVDDETRLIRAMDMGNG